MAESSKRKTWKNITSTSSEEESLLPVDKKLKCDKESDLEGNSESPDEIIRVLNMTESIMPKLEMIFEKLEKLDEKLDSLEKYVKAVDGKVSKLQQKVEAFEKFMQNTGKTVELQDGLSFANEEREAFKQQLKDLTVKVDKLKDEKLYMEVYQRRENLRFFGIEETNTGDNEEDTRQVLVDFLEDKLGIGNARNFEFQRVHRIGKYSNSQEKRRQIIARFLRYSDREHTMTNAKKLKGTVHSISADLPKEIVDRRKGKMHRLKKKLKKRVSQLTLVGPNQTFSFLIVIQFNPRFQSSGAQSTALAGCYFIMKYCVCFIDIVLFSLLLLGVDSLEVDRFVGFVYFIFFYFSVFVKVSCFFVSFYLSLSLRFSFWFSHYRSLCFQSVSILPRLSHLQKVIPFASLCFNPTRN